MTIEKKEKKYYKKFFDNKHQMYAYFYKAEKNPKISWITGGYFLDIQSWAIYYTYK